MSKRQLEPSHFHNPNLSHPNLRDPRLDFFRGLGMFIIFIAHVPGNEWVLYIPARFGFSDATEIFVFCSGMASALAFGKVFRECSWGLGTARVLYRTWQVYWVHIALFLSILTLMISFNTLGVGHQNYVAQLNLQKFFENAEQNVLGLMTLTYVPNYFDILPMYIGILLMMPFFMLLRKFSVIAPFLLMAGLWLATQFSLLQLPAEPWSDRQWFFNPFAWQLVFFTGFAFMAGWLKPPPVNTSLFVFCVVVLIAIIPFAHYLIINETPWIQELRRDYGFLINKTNMGPLRYVHFLALAYVCWVLAGPGGERLHVKTGILSFFVRIIHKVGQQALATFIAGMFMAQFFGMVLDVVGRTQINFAFVNFSGFLCLIATAYTVAWFKKQPWKSSRPNRQTHGSEPMTPRETAL